jgi:hypothetical protein
MVRADRLAIDSMWVAHTTVIVPAALWPWGSIQPLKEMSTRNLPGGRGRSARKSDNVTAICEPIV